MNILYKWFARIGSVILAALVFMAQREKIKRQKEHIESVEKVNDVNTAVTEANKQSEIEARKNVEKAVESDESVRNYFLNDSVRNDKD